MKKIFKVYLTNLDTINAMCGWGEGRTREEAIQKALVKARETDQNAFYDGGTVCFHGGANR